MKSISDLSLVKSSSYINGEWYEGEAMFSVYNPATGQCIANVSDANDTLVKQAVEFAKKAFCQWSNLSAYKRAQHLQTWCALIRQHIEDLSRILTLEQGKPLAESRGEIAYGASFIEWFAEEAKRVCGDTIPSSSDDKRIMVLKQPIGVVSAITPWNFPNAMITRKAAAAMAAGCTFVVRPSELTPLSALALAELAERAGIPAGVFNVVVGQDAPSMGKVLTQHPDVSKFTFTGSTAVGKVLSAQCATTVKKVSMELGGNAPFIVFEDADIAQAVNGAIASKYRNAGQTCICTNRIFVDEKIVDDFTKQYLAAVNKLTVGNGVNDDISVGPMITEQAVKRVDRLVTESVYAGAHVLTGGKLSDQGKCYYPPTILTNVCNDMPVAQNEIFGPISAIISFKDEQEVIQQANDTDYGLAAYFYAKDINRVWRVAEQLEYGMVGVNEANISNAAAPFGGVKQSGYGREGSKYGLDDYLEIKYVCIGGMS